MRHSVLLRRYMLTMVCMILIPCCLLLTLFYSSLSGNLIREAENMLQSQAQAVMDVYDSAIAACVQTSVQISNDSVISPYNLRSNRYESVEALQRLRLYGIQLDFCDAILLNVRGEETLYSQNGLIGLDALLRFAGEEFSMLKQQYTDLLNTCDSIFSHLPTCTSTPATASTTLSYSRPGACMGTPWAPCYSKSMPKLFSQTCSVA